MDPELYESTIRLPAAEVGPDNPLPVADQLLEAPFEIGDGLPAQLREAAAIGRPRSLHPYLVQDDYVRQRQVRDLQTVVLDNGILRATFLPGLGGRLWSLVDVASGRDLVYANTAVQPANLALRNAWVAGGVEWNIGTKGHSAHTMASLHAATVEGPDGLPRLRMWEFDRLRRVVFQIDAWLPRGARGLHVYVRIENPNEHRVPMYWWSNAAAPEGPDVRVLAPATEAYATAYDGTVGKIGIPADSGRDHTWPAQSPRSADYFYLIDSHRTPWVASVDSTGRGLAIVSTPGLPGRKLFCWGDGAGGRHWQRWLSPEGGQYLELQAGLSTTQFEHAMMPPGASWDWVEVYGEVRDARAEIAHGQDWDAAVQHVQERALAVAGGDDLQQVLSEARQIADEPVARHVATGSGWGALEREVRRAGDEPWIEESSRPFGTDTLGPQQAPWWQLLVYGTDPFAGADPAVAPPSYVTGRIWREKLRALPPSWLRDYHLGVLAQSRGDLAEAREYFRSSQSQEATAWAVRGEARILAESGEENAAADLLAQAVQLAPHSTPLLLEAMTAVLAIGQAQRALDLFDAAPAAVSTGGRARLLEGTAALRAGARERAEAVLVSDIVIPDIREGERSLSDLWREVFPEQDVPSQYDFRMA